MTCSEALEAEAIVPCSASFTSLSLIQTVYGKIYYEAVSQLLKLRRSAYHTTHYFEVPSYSNTFVT